MTSLNSFLSGNFKVSNSFEEIKKYNMNKNSSNKKQKTHSELYRGNIFVASYFKMFSP